MTLIKSEWFFFTSSSVAEECGGEETNNFLWISVDINSHKNQNQNKPFHIN